jgi:hypothetical protein
MFSWKEKSRVVDVELNHSSTKHVVKCSFGGKGKALICFHDFAVVIGVLVFGVSVEDG